MGFPRRWCSLSKAGFPRRARFNHAEFRRYLCVSHHGEGFTWETQDKERDIAAAGAAWEKAKTLIRDARFRMVLLDENQYRYALWLY